MAESDTQEMAANARKYWSAEGYTEGGVIREVDYASQSGGLDPMFEGIKIVDTDTHITEAPDLFTSRAPAGWKDKMPRVERVNGTDRWFVGNRDFGTLGGNVIRADNNKLLGRLAFPKLEQAHPGGHELKARLQAMDDMGVYAQICFQNSGVTQAGSLMSLGDLDLALKVIQIYNDASAEFQETSGQRIFNMAHLPFWDQKALEAEAKRCHDIGLKGFVLPDTPERVGVPSFNHDYWTPFLEMCEATGMPLNFHLNAAIDPNTLTWEGFQFEQTLSVVATMFSIGNAATLGNWMVSGRLDQHPKLKIGLIESGAGWVPFAVEALEHQFREMLPIKRDVLKKQPWDYFRDHFFCTFWFEKIAPKYLLEIIGVDNVMFETDFPHPTSLYPGVQEHLKDVLGGYDHATRKKVLQDNAVRLYNLPF
ncbi:amidohydrolase family protein [Novosphingobium guangzhouense]|uniref:Amidohydrolase n=1 Tax=Novosphingobium guangzhouense TaxID=1850347 RepID=A0A2K2G5U5_9SPHN|nr:amidohydrolase family protein [Novosphingobium guangzhouense]PNU06407.1 amidohydrolase [Novosphingobium guangzhouense]